MRCPRCDSPSPEMHPAVQFEGEVQPCTHPFHKLARPMDKFQEAHRAWLQRNFPEQVPEHPAAGCVEEAGELMHALLKCQQWRVWGDEDRYKGKQWRLELEDAIGDCAIFACSLCNTNDWDFADLLCLAEYNVYVLPGITAFDSVAELVAASVDVARYPESKASLHMYLKRLASICLQFTMDLRECIEKTWLKVKERNRGAETSARS